MTRRVTHRPAPVKHQLHSFKSAVAAKAEDALFGLSVDCRLSAGDKVGSLECPPITASGPCRPNGIEFEAKTSSKPLRVQSKREWWQRVLWTSTQTADIHSISICSNAQMVLHNISFTRSNLLWLQRLRTHFLALVWIVASQQVTRWAPLNARTRQLTPHSRCTTAVSPKTKTKEILQCRTMGVCRVHSALP